MMTLEGKTALITGGSRGIGREIALELASRGCDVAIGYHSDHGAAASVCAQITALGRTCKAIQADVGRSSEADLLVSEAMAMTGSLDIVVSNAGVTRDALLVRMTDEKWADVIGTNLTGTFNVTRAAARYMMRQRKGTMVLVSSIVGLGGNAGQANYAASKAGVIALARSAAKELGGRGITVNVVAPGFVETDMTRVLDKGVVSSYLASIPLKRAGMPADIAKAVAFLVSPEAAYITGQILVVDGGMSL